MACRIGNDIVWCGLLIKFSDGSQTAIAINDVKDATLALKPVLEEDDFINGYRRYVKPDYNVDISISGSAVQWKTQFTDTVDATAEIDYQATRQLTDQR